METIDIFSKKELKTKFKITYTSSEIESVNASFIEPTEDFEEFISFYYKTDKNTELVCMINKALIRKIEVIQESG